MPRRYGADGTRLWNGKTPEEFTEADAYRFMAETEGVLQRKELMDDPAQPAPASGKEEFYLSKKDDVLLTPEQIAAEERRWLFDAPIAELAEVKGVSIDEAVKMRTDAVLQEAVVPITVSVRPIEPQGKLIGFASVNFGGVVIDDFKVVDGKNGIFLGAPSKPDPASRTGYRATVRIPDRTTQERINAAGVEAYHAAWNSLLHGPRRYGLPRSRSRWPRPRNKLEKKTPPGLRLPRQRRPAMTDSHTLGQSVPKEGLFLLDGIEGLRSLPKHSVDMLLTDPPYGTTRNYWDVPLPLPELWEAVKWAVKPNGAVLFFAQCPFDKVLGASNLAMLRYEWIWYKERGTGFLNANRAPLKKSENILVFYQKSPVYNPQFTYGKPYTRVHSRSGTSSNYGKFERQGSESNDGRRYPGNVLFVPTVSGGIHPTQKPVELCEYLIRTYTRPGELVADICVGSGTTAIAAINTERRFVCFETAPSFYAAASERIRAAQAVKSSGEKGV